MGYKDVTPGTRTAKATAARLVHANQKWGIEVAFKFVEPTTNTEESLSRVYWLSSAALENSMTSLVEVLDYNGMNTHDDNGVLTDPNVINYNKEVSLVLETESYDDKDGNPKTKVVIKWVNNLSGSQFASVTPEVIRSFDADMGSLGFKAAFLAAKAKNGSPKPKAAATASVTATASTATEDDLPF